MPDVPEGHRQPLTTFRAVSMGPAQAGPILISSIAQRHDPLRASAWRALADFRVHGARIAVCFAARFSPWPCALWSSCADLLQWTYPIEKLASRLKQLRRRAVECADVQAQDLERLDDALPSVVVPANRSPEAFGDRPAGDPGLAGILVPYWQWHADGPRLSGFPARPRLVDGSKRATSTPCARGSPRASTVRAASRMRSSTAVDRARRAGDASKGETGEEPGVAAPVGAKRILLQ
jgi:hypothetical protein